MNLITGLFIIIAGLTGYLLYERSKRRSAEALNANSETKEKVDEIQKNVEVNNAKIQTEEEKQAEAKKKAEEEKAKNVTNDDILDFFNKSNK